MASSSDNGGTTKGRRDSGGGGIAHIIRRNEYKEWKRRWRKDGKIQDE
jgi:hypothetical protein